jgi:hypothetical protein
VLCSVLLLYYGGSLSRVHGDVLVIFSYYVQAPDIVLSTTDTMLQRLKILALDFRPEVRNCAVNTLFTSLVTHTPQLTLDQWNMAFFDVIFTLLSQIGAR